MLAEVSRSGQQVRSAGQATGLDTTVSTSFEMDRLVELPVSATEQYQPDTCSTPTPALSERNSERVNMAALFVAGMLTKILSSLMMSHPHVLYAVM